ncbi:MAG: hypothetical protein M3N46_10625 [Actinomycetota bacterium]|nr:hypothetical protein [Actinomycetota bacterium]
MGSSFTLADTPTLDDLQVFLARAARIEEGSVRLIAGSGVLATYSAVFYPQGLLDESPTVLGLRTVALTDPEEVFDVVVPIRSLLTRLENAQSVRRGAATAGSPDAEGPVTITLPMEVNTVTWSAISPPRGGWYPIAATEASVLDRAARAGIEEVAKAVPDAVGEQILRRVRSEVWSRGIEGLEHVPAGAAFAALSLGFLGEDEVRMFETGPWTRLTTLRGHVLVKRKAWTLAR